MISLLTRGLSRVFFNTTVQRHQFFGAQPLWSNSHMTTGKTIALTMQIFVGEVFSLLFYMSDPLEKEVATHSNILAWRIPQTEEPGGLPLGSKVSDTNLRPTLSHTLGLSPFKEQSSFNFMAAVTIYSDFGAQENKICHCFHFSPLFAMK